LTTHRVSGRVPDRIDQAPRPRHIVPPRQVRPRKEPRAGDDALPNCARGESAEGIRGEPNCREDPAQDQDLRPGGPLVRVDGLGKARKKSATFGLESSTSRPRRRKRAFCGGRIPQRQTRGTRPDREAAGCQGTAGRHPRRSAERTAQEPTMRARRQARPSSRRRRSAHPARTRRQPRAPPGSPLEAPCETTKRLLGPGTAAKTAVIPTNVSSVAESGIGRLPRLVHCASNPA
jgi:hypothetical protein